MNGNIGDLAGMAMNKMKYKLFKAAYDPEAEKMASTASTVNKDSLLTKAKKGVNKLLKRGEGYEQKPLVTPPTQSKPKKMSPTDQFITGFTTTFNVFILPVIIVFFCSLAGSIAANDAIGRSPGIRLVYFLYGTIPIFSPLVFIYYLVRYFMKTYPVWYNFLPLTTWQPENNILKILLTPFVYNEDANTKYMYQQFDQSAKKWIDGFQETNNSKTT